MVASCASSAPKTASVMAKTAKDQDRIAQISEQFADFEPAQVTTAISAKYLKTFYTRPRTFNLHRAMLRQVLAFAAIEGLREVYNPIDDIPRKTLAGRKRVGRRTPRSRRSRPRRCWPRAMATRWGR